MNRDVFHRRFEIAAKLARDFAQEFLKELLPTDLRFRLRLNQSYDANASEGHRLFPKDSSLDRAIELSNVSSDEFVRELWRDGLVPQWVNMNVIGVTETATLIEILACGRFTADEDDLYHIQEEIPPFHVLGPALPVDYVEGAKFSIFTRSSCWSHGELVRARQNSEEVWSLEIRGPFFTDELAQQTLAFPQLTILELRGASICGTGFDSLACLPKLRHLRMTCGEIDSLDFSRLPVLPSIESLSITNLPKRLTGLSEFQEVFRHIRQLTLGSVNRVDADSGLVLPGIDRWTLSFPTPQSWILGVPGATSVSLAMDQASDADVDRILESARESISSVSLQGTPVTDALLPLVARLPNLQYVNLVRTNVTEEALESFARDWPGLKYFPRKFPPG